MCNLTLAIKHLEEAIRALSEGNTQLAKAQIKLGFHLTEDDLPHYVYIDASGSNVYDPKLMRKMITTALQYDTDELFCFSSNIERFIPSDGLPGNMGRETNFEAVHNHYMTLGQLARVTVITDTTGVEQLLLGEQANLPWEVVVIQ